MNRPAALTAWAAPAALLSVLVAVSLPGCVVGEIKTIVLPPSTFETFRAEHTDTADWACWPVPCLVNYWVGDCQPSSDPPEGVLVGTKHDYDNGTLPCNCWKRRDCFYRGAVRFDLGQFVGKSIVGARLRWDSRGECVAKMYVSSHSWPTWAKPPGLRIFVPWSGLEVEVGPTVREWVEGTASNFGWVFVGEEENETHGEAQIGGGSSPCPSTIDGFELEVLYRD